MNFQQIRDSLGQMDGEYQAKAEIVGTVRKVKKVEFSKSTGKPGQSLSIEIDSGEQDWVKMIGEFDPLDETSMGKTFTFLVWPFKPAQSPKTYLYCWIQRQSSQNSSQAPQTTPQQQNPPQGNIITEGIRLEAIKTATMLISAGKHTTVELYTLSDFIAEYIKYGKHPTGVAGANPPEQDFPEEPG